MKKMVNYMLTQEEILKEQFNNKDFFKEDKNRKSKVETEVFILYYVDLLQYAFELTLISDEARNNIANLIMQEINKLAKSNTNVMANYMYIITLYLNSKTNWEAFCEFRKITDEKEANAFITNASQWIIKQLKELETALKNAKKNVISLEEKNILETFKSLELEVSNFKKFSSPDVSLKKLHKTVLIASYQTLETWQTENYFEELKKSVKVFLIEISIMVKIDAKSIINYRKTEVKRVLKNEQKQVSDFLKMQEKEEEKLKKEYEEDLEKAYQEQMESERFLQECEEDFRKQHSDLTGDEFEEAFDEYLDNLPEEEFPSSKYDENEIRARFEEGKRELAKKYKNKEKNLEEDLQRTDFMINKNLTLSDIVKEITLYYLAKNNMIAYPETLTSREELLSKMSIQKSIEVFLNTEKAIDLSQEEKDYLIGACK